MSKKVSKLPFVDRNRYDNGLLMDSEKQLVTLAVKDGDVFDAEQLTRAVEDAGYKVEQIYVLTATGEREVWSP